MAFFLEVHDWSASVNCFQNISGPDQKSITNTIEVSKIYIFYEPLLLKFQSSMQWNFSCAFWIFSWSKVYRRSSNSKDSNNVVSSYKHV